MIKILLSSASGVFETYYLVDEYGSMVAENLLLADAIKIRDLWNAPHAVKTPVPASPEAEKDIEKRIEQTVGQWPSATGLHWTFDLARLYPDYTVSKRLMTIKGVVLEFAQPPKLYVERRANPADRRKTQLQQAAQQNQQLPLSPSYVLRSSLPNEILQAKQETAKKWNDLLERCSPHTGLVPWEYIERESLDLLNKVGLLNESEEKKKS